MRHVSGKGICVLLATAGMAALLVGVSSGPASAESAAEFYKGRTVKLIVGYGPGGGFDLYSRMLAPHFERETGATFVVENKPGNGGLNAMNGLVRGNQDGSEIMLLNGEAAMLAVLVDKEGVRFNLAETTFLGRVSAEPHVLLVNAKTPFKTPLDLVHAKGPIKMGAGNRTDGIGDVEISICEALKLNCKMVTGYRGSKESALSVVNGESDAFAIVESSAQNYLKGGKLRAIGAVTRSKFKLKNLPDVPSFSDTPGITEEGKWWINFRASVAGMGRTLVGPPHMPKDRVEYLRAVFKKVLTDPKVMAEGAKVQRWLVYADPAETTKFVRNYLAHYDAKTKAKVKNVILNKF